jgi:hypothetical protein
MPADIPKIIREAPLNINVKPKKAPAVTLALYGMKRNHEGFSPKLRLSSMPPTKNMEPARNIK